MVLPLSRCRFHRPNDRLHAQRQKGRKSRQTVLPQDAEGSQASISTGHQCRSEQRLSTCHRGVEEGRHVPHDLSTQTVQIPQQPFMFIYSISRFTTPKFNCPLLTAYKSAPILL